MQRFGLTCSLVAFGLLLGPFWGTRADEGTSGADGYVKIKVDVELRGVLSSTQEIVTISVGKDQKWVLDFGKEKDQRTRAKDLDGKTVLVQGIATLQYKARTVERLPGREPAEPRGLTMSAFEAEPKVVVRSLVAATRE
jgi:hypothetical protein